MNPITLRCDSLLGGKRWVLWQDRLVLESQEFLSGYSPDAHVIFSEVRAVYRFRRAQPLYLLWLLLGIPLLLIGLSLALSGASMSAAVVAAIGVAISGPSFASGIRQRPHLAIDTPTGRHVIRMDRPWYRPELRRTFFRTLSQLLGIPDVSV